MDDNNNKLKNVPVIADYFRNKSIFITGGTGFLGKQLIEKLIRSCYDLNKIYLLIRVKKGKQPSERLDEIFNNKLYDPVRKLYPNFREKIVAINGDIMEPDLGISGEDAETLANNVNIIYHSAATVRFDEPLKVAVGMNVIGVKKVINLASKMKNLEVFVHVSTAYANCDRTHISEEVYNSPVKPEKIIEACEWFDDDLVNQLTPKVIKSRPNTYTYTKAIAESLVLQETKEKNLPCVIIRPSIVGATWREPFPGWVDNFNGPTALFPAAGCGALKIMLGNYEATADIIPVDVVNNLMIAASWYMGSGRTRKMLIYNCTSGQINKFTWGMLQTYGMDCIYSHPFENILFVPNPQLTTNKFVKSFKLFFQQIVPSYIMDFFLTICQKKPFFVRLQAKIAKAVEILEYFTTKQWEFTNDNLYMLTNELNQQDSKVFNFDIRDLDWKSYVLIYYLGAKVHLMKEDLSRTDICIKKLMRAKRIENLIWVSISLLIFRFVLKRSTNVQFFFKFLFNMALKLASRITHVARIC